MNDKFDDIEYSTTGLTDPEGKPVDMTPKPGDLLPHAPNGWRVEPGEMIELGFGHFCWLREGPPKYGRFDRRMPTEPPYPQAPDTSLHPNSPVFFVWGASRALGQSENDPESYATVTRHILEAHYARELALRQDAIDKDETWMHLINGEWLRPPITWLDNKIVTKDYDRKQLELLDDVWCGKHLVEPCTQEDLERYLAQPRTIYSRIHWRNTKTKISTTDGQVLFLRNEGIVFKTETL